MGGDESRQVLSNIEDYNFEANFHPTILHNYDAHRESGSVRLVRLRRRKNVFALPCEAKRGGTITRFDFFSSRNAFAWRMKFPQAIGVVALTFHRKPFLAVIAL